VQHDIDTAHAPLDGGVVGEITEDDLEVLLAFEAPDRRDVLR